MFMESTTNQMLIGTLAEAAGVGVETVRFYEREGLIPEPPRSASGYRLYDVDAVRRLRFIRSAKDLGFTLAETKELLELRVTDTTGCDDNEQTGECPILDALDHELDEETES